MANALADSVKRASGRPGRGQPVLVGFSGGLDSTALLHLLAHDADTRSAGLRAIHVHHGLHADADAWSAHCARVCSSLSVPLETVRVRVNATTGLGLEGAARTARHRVFEDTLRPDEVLALAHHRDDQAETFLLRALRGSGVDGLAAMRAWRVFADGWLWRPLLDTARAELQAYAHVRQLSWIEDPSNTGTAQDRNFLRNEVLPLLQARWPHASTSFARSACLASNAAELLVQEDDALLASLASGNTLHVDALLTLPAARRARVLRAWADARALPPLPANGIDCIEQQLLHARVDADACFAWAGACIRRWRDVLHASNAVTALPLDWSHTWDGASALTLPTGDTLQLVGATRFDAPLRVHARQGGERIVQPGRQHSHALKHLLQEHGIPPWQRMRLPLLSDGEELLAAGDGILSARMAGWLRARCANLRWTCLA